MPRPYNLGRRAEPKADTRARIVAAALALYRDRGMSGTSNLGVARAADVAPATVRNHFPEPADLARAVFDGMLAEIRIPTPTVFDGLEDLRVRVTRLAEELAALYERSEPWWRAYEREPELISAWRGGVDQHYAAIERLMRAGLGELGSDEESVAVVASVIGPPTFFALRGRGLSSADAVRLTLELVVPWLERRRDRPANATPSPALPTSCRRRRTRGT
jgi:AcrR family transcriptional regulator